MASLYPSLEDMKVDQMCRAQIQNEFSAPAPPSYNPGTYNAGVQAQVGSEAHVYPALGDYMGLEFSETLIKENMPEYVHQVAIFQQSIPAGGTTMIAPISSQSLGLQKAQVTHGIRELLLCKDQNNKIGLRVKDINKGIFVCLVIENSPAALGGLRFGDQILQINGQDLAGYSTDKVHELLKKSPVNGIRIVVRDRPFERTITLHKDSVGSLGFQFKNGKIVAIVKESSAARNGVLTEHQLLEVDGQNVVGLKDKQIKEIMDKAGDIVTITVIPSFVYEHMVKKMAGSLIRNLMDHSIPIL
ncbi:syntenin-1-like [Cylas formicarius]|uniref:syntenin-1-like n=1 Tax=Cylas formicarius TaxID=197179 RepID=UPI0029589348|nr:syntenin-1-like [Cylas formicarius]